MKSRYFFYIIFMTILINLSCGDGGLFTPDEEVEVPEGCDDYPPSYIVEDNDLITFQRTYGREDEQHSFWSISRSGDGNVFYNGFFNDNSNTITVIVGEDGEVESSTIDEEDINNYGVGKLSQSGSILWSKSPGYLPRAIEAVSANAGSDYQYGLAVAGVLDGLGYIIIYSASGERLAEATVENCWFNEILFIEDLGGQLELIAAGGRDNLPFIYHFSVDKASHTITTLNSKQIGTGLTSWAIDLEKVNNDLFGTIISDNAKSQVILCTFNRALEVITLKSILSGSNIDDGPNVGLEYHDNAFYYACTEDDMDKEETPSSGGYWSTGVLVKTDLEGNRQWAYSYPISERSDHMKNMYFFEGNLYAIGTYGAVCKNDSKCCYENGVIFHINASDGTIINRTTFNVSGKLDAFNDMDLIGDKVFVAGKVNEHKNEEETWQYQSWLGAFNLNDLQ